MTTREVVLDGGSPWGFRMHGGVDVQQPLRISRVNSGSKAATKGIREGDIITSINGENTRDKTNAEAHALLKGAGSTLKLGLNEDCSGGSPKKRQYSNKTVQQETHSETIKRSNISSTYIVSTTKNQTQIETSIDTNRSAAKENSDRNEIKINGESKSNIKDYFSDRSTISSNYSSAASTPSTLAESQVKEHNKKMPEQSKDKQSKWVGLPTEDDPQLIVCLSPTQKSLLETTKKVPNEADKLLDLHNKFLKRRGYHENITETNESQNTDGEMTNRLLAIIRESSSSRFAAATSAGREDPNDYLYYEEKNKSLPRSNSLDEKANEEARLQARNLSEWLQLAKDKSKSDTQLNLFNDMKDNRVIAINIPKSDVYVTKRRQSLPHEFYIQQMQYLIQKEKEIQEELEMLEEEKRKLVSEIDNSHVFDHSKYHISKNEDIAFHNDEVHTEKAKHNSKAMLSTEHFRQQMYNEYMRQVAERQDRQQNKVIKISSRQNQPQETKEKLEVTHVKGIEDEFMSKVKQRKIKYGLNSEDSGDYTSLERSDGEDSEPVLVMDGDNLSEAKKLPKHLREFIDITRKAASALDKDTEDGIWSPGQRDTSDPNVFQRQRSQEQETILPVWTPKSAGSSPSFERKEFRPVNFESPILGRKNKSDGSEDSTPIDPPWKSPSTSSDIGVALASSLEKRLPNSYSAPATGFTDYTTPRLPKAQNPTITLLQKARGGHLPKGAAYIEQDQIRLSKHESLPKLAPGEVVYEIKNEYISESESENPKKMADLGPKKFMGIGPTTKDGMPLTLRSEVRDQNQSKWYKRMYDTIHKQKPRYDDDYVTVRYKQRRGRYPYNSGYLSEPEPGAYDSDVSIYDHRITTLDRRRVQPAAFASDSYTTSYTMPRSSTNSYAPQSNTVKHGKEVYRNQPGRIENYVPGHSSISDKESKEWWDEVMDIFDGHLEQQKQSSGKGYMSQALKESGYESDSTLIFRRRDEAINQLSPSEQREAYRTIQKGGDVPLRGLRKLAPERPKDDLNIEYIPISPNLTRIRVHKNTPNKSDSLIYPINIPSHEHIFAKYKRTAPSTVSVSKLPPLIPPSPPKRKSSRNNSTLRLISTMKMSTDKPGKRHETCFTSTSDVNKSNVKYLRDKITCKLSPASRKKGEARLKVTKTLTANPELKSKLITSLSTCKDSRSSSNKIYSKTNILREPEKCCLTKSNSTNSVRKICRSCSASPPIKKLKPQPIKLRATSLDRTFGSEKRKIDLILPKSVSDKRLIKSPDLVSPTEVKKASVLTQIPQKHFTKYSKTVLASVKNGLKKPSKPQELPTKISASDKAKVLPRNTRSSSVPTTPVITRPLRSRNDSISPAPSTSSDKSKVSKSSVSLESIKSIKSMKKEKSPLKKSTSIKSVGNTASRENIYVLKKAKKDQLNDEIVKKERKSTKIKTKDTISCTGRAAGNEIIKKMQSIKSSKGRAPITLEDIQKQKEYVQKNSFFQNLFLRNNPTPKNLTSKNNSWIAEKALALQRRATSVSEHSAGALKIYLNHTKPVSDSKFKTLDAQMIRSRSVSPKNVRWEDDTKREYVRKNILYERSSSLPPKLVFTETSRPISPIIHRRRQDTDSKRTTIIRQHSPQKLIFTETSRPVSPIIQSKTTLNKLNGEADKITGLNTIKTTSLLIAKKSLKPEKIIFTETIRPISPDVRSTSASPKPGEVDSDKGKLRSTTPETYLCQAVRPYSPVSEHKQSVNDTPETIIRSPSYRKIRSLHGESIEYIKRGMPRSRSASEADEKHYHPADFEPSSLTQSTSSIDSIKEYQTYVKEIIHSTKKSDRFKELNKFYSAIERLGQLERATSSTDLRPRRKNEEEIIDYDRWKEVRQREKAERELNTIYKELKESQKEKDLLFMPKYVEAYKWKRDFDRGLRIKEKSVEDIKEDFERKKLRESEGEKGKLLEFDYKKDVYKPLWRGSSVVNLAQTMVERRSHSEGRDKTSKQGRLETERLLTYGIGSKIWSSLSLEQVNVLKNQLAEIYQNGNRKMFQEKTDYIVEVPENKKFTSETLLKVRRNSDSSKSMEQDKKYFSSDIKDFGPSLSEMDKKRLSQSLSKEILERQQQRYKTSLSLVLGKETRGAIAAAEAKIRHAEPPSPRTCYSLEMSEDGEKDKKYTDSDFLLVLAKSDTTNKASIKETLTKWAQPKKALVRTDAINIQKTSSTSETESGSTDDSTKTVVCVDKKDVKKKVQYFENVLEKDDYTPTVYKPAEPSSDEQEIEPIIQKLPTQEKSSKKVALSRSYQNLKELFGETDSAKLTSPISNASLGSISSLQSPLTYSSDSIYRSRSLSPHSNMYYFSLIKQGDVHKLKDKFEKKHKLSVQPRRCNSDSQINRKSQIHIPGQITGDVDNLRRRYEYPAIAGRGRSRVRRGGVVSPIHLKAEDRFMPHINIISKIASLYPRKSTKREHERSIEELAEFLGITVGEVKKMRQKFDSPERNMSLLGHMFTSSPNLHELRDIAPYLTASWTAHKYPRKEDNTRPLTPPVYPITPTPSSCKKHIQRPKSASPTRPKVKLSSILKPEPRKEEIKKKEFDPSIHQPISRYQPPVPRVEPVRYRSWWSPMSTHNRPTVTFKGVVFMML